MLNLLQEPHFLVRLMLAATFPFILFQPIKFIYSGLRSRNWRKVKATITTNNVDRENGAYPNIVYK